jgi:hypothetical protein
MHHNNDSETPRDAHATDTPLITDPRALYVRGHVWLRDLHDPAAPIYVNGGEDVWAARNRDRVDARCAGCDASHAVQHDRWSVLIVSGHQDGCPWFADWLRQAVESGAITPEGHESFTAWLRAEAAS